MPKGVGQRAQSVRLAPQRSAPDGFVMTVVETKRASEFCAAHAGKLGRHRGVGGARFTYEFQNTGIGTRVTVRCACGGVADITEYESW